MSRTGQCHEDEDEEDCWSLEDEDDDEQDGEVEDGDDVDDHGNFSNPL